MKETPRFTLSIDGQLCGFTSTGLVLDHTSRRVRGSAIAVGAPCGDPNGESFCNLLRGLGRGQTVRLCLSTSQGEVEYDGEAEVVMIRERFSRNALPAVSFVFRLLGA